MKVYVEGKLKTRSWEKDGQIRRKTEVIAENIQILYRPEIYRKSNEGMNAAEPLTDAPEALSDEASEIQGAPEEGQNGIFSGLFR